MRTKRPATIGLSILAALVLIVAAVLLLPKLLFGQSADSERDAREQIKRRVETFAAQVVAQSTDPAGPALGELAKPVDRVTLRYAADRSTTALTAVWVEGSARAGGAFGPYEISECYALAFHDLGKPGAGSQTTHLTDCRDVTARLGAATPSPAVS